MRMRSFFFRRMRLQSKVAALALAFLALLASSAQAAKSAGGMYEYAKVGDDTGVDGQLPIKVEGIGLVVNLPGTGSDPPPNQYREMILNIMKKKDVVNPQEMLASDKTAVVLLRAYLPPGSRKGDMIDVEVWVPPGDSTTSLKGGWLLPSMLAENMVARGKTSLKGRDVVEVTGPVLVTENKSDKEDTAALRKGKVLGGGRTMLDRDFRIVLTKETRSGRRTRKLAQRINQRFYVHHGGQNQGLANALDEKLIELKLAKAYRYDFQRYLLVARRIPESSSESFRQTLLSELREELHRPETTLEAALRLEAIGSPATPILKESLTSKSEVVRFASAQALAYLGDGSGVEELGRIAEHSNVYRAHALGALTALDHPVSRIQLSRLLNAPIAEVRYGAFRALWTFDHQDPLVKGELLKDQFWLHEVPSSSEPMVHVSRNFRREIVLFDNKQTLQPPLSLKAGDFILLNADRESDQVFIASFRPGEKGPQRRRSESSLRLGDVLREVVNLGAGYADVVDLLQQASAQGNLKGRLEVNALPQALPLETMDAIARSEEKRTRPPSASGPSFLTIVGEGKSPNLSRDLIPPPSDETAEVKKDADKPKASKGWFRRLSN